MHGGGGMSVDGPNVSLLDAAADWVIRMHYETPDPATQQAFKHWLGQGEAHAQAWARAQSVLGSFDRVPAAIGQDVLRTRGRGRRALLRAMAGGLVILPAAWLAGRDVPRWVADLKTSTGERRAWSLADGSRLVLNTRSAVDVRFTETQRRLVLVSGEVLVTTGPDVVSHYRPLVIETAQGEVQALGTRFRVRQLDKSTQVSVFEHAVELRPSDADPIRLTAGQETTFTRERASGTHLADLGAIAWEQGMLVVTDWRLADVIAELNRYRPGVLRCAREVASLRVSGALSVSDTDAALQALSARLPIRVNRVGPYWVTVGPRV